MNFDLRPDGILLFQEHRVPRFLRVAVALSILLHILMLLSSPYWQSRVATGERIVQIDIAEMPKDEAPRIPEVPIRVPEAVPPPPPRPTYTVKDAVPTEATAPTREAIREKVASKGLLKMFGGKGDADPLPEIRVPGDLRPAPPRATANPADYAPRNVSESGKAKSPGIERELAATARASKEMTSRTFKTDTGMEAEIAGASGEPSRSFQSIAATVKQYQGGIKYAYNREVLANPNLSGNMLVSFVIRPDGAVESVEVRQSTLNW
ncbi:MAG: AgmX/PglI C-terminal domain-containing protein, partial [bacterium]|nr:AgmX/PglI C-terminal domain-containing protein [bacterium]